MDRVIQLLLGYVDILLGLACFAVSIAFFKAALKGLVAERWEFKRASFLKDDQDDGYL